MNTTHVSVDLARAILADGTPADITPTYDAPWNATLMHILEMFQGTCIYILVGLFICAGLAWAGTKIIKSPSGQQTSIVVCLICLAAAAMVACAGGFIWWSAHINLMPAMPAH